MAELGLSDVVPLLRVDLKIGDPVSGRGEAEVQVVDPATNAGVNLKGFEVSIARMLNGKRTAEEVLSASGQIGLPLSIESFNRFLKKLESYGFLRPSGAELPPDPTTWEPRAEWGEEIRRLFQEALREARADRFLAAKSRLDTLLARAPATREAQQLLHWVMLRLRPDALPLRTAQFSDIFSEAEKTWFAEADRSSAAAERAAAQAGEDSGDDFGEAPRPRSRKGLVFVFLLLVVGGAGLMFPLARTATAPFTLVPGAVTEIKVPHAGVLSQVVVAEGQWVDQGATLARWDVSATEKKAQQLASQLAAAEAKLKPAKPSKKATEAKAKLTKAEGELKKAQAELKKATAKAKGKKSPALTKAEKKVTAATAAVALAGKAVEAAAPPVSEKAKAEVAALQQQLAATKAEAADSALVASAKGFVLGLTAKPGPVEAGAVLGRLEDSRTLKVVLRLPAGEAPSVGAPVQLSLGSESKKVELSKVEGREAEASLDNAKGDWRGGATGEASFPGAPSSLFVQLKAKL